MEQKEKYFKIWDIIKKHKNFTLVTHVDPDGDTIGAAYAFKHLLLNNIGNAEVKISGQKAPRYLDFVNDTEEVSDAYFNDSLKIVIDTSTKSRIADSRVITEESIKIDHHGHENTWLEEIGGDNWPSTGEVIYNFVDLHGFKLTDEIKKGIFVAIWTDTEGMTQREPTERTWEALNACGDVRDICLEKMQLNDYEKEAIENFKKQIKVEGDVTYLLSEDIASNDFLRQMIGDFSNECKTEVFISLTKNELGEYRGEIRSKDNVDVSVFAKSFGGGGHFASSGFKTNTLENAKEKYVDYIINQIK